MGDFLVSVIGPVAATLFGILFLSFLVIIPIVQMETRAFVKEFQQTVETVKVVRAKNEMPEADIMITANQNLAKYKYYNDVPIIGWTVTDKIDDLKPIE